MNAFLNAPTAGDGIQKFFQALAMGPMVRQQAQMKAALVDAQVYQAMMGGNKAAADIEKTRTYLQQRNQALSETAGAGASAYEKNMNFLARLVGDNLNPATLTQGALNAQKGTFRQSMLDHYGDPGTDREKTGFLNAMLDGKSYEPYSPIGESGYMANKATGQSVLGASSLAAYTQAAKQAQLAGQAKHYDPTNGVVVDLRNGAAQPAMLASGQPLVTRVKTDAFKAQAAVDGTVDKLGRMEALTRAIKDDPALWRITGTTGTLPNIPGSAAADLEARLHTLKNQVGIAVIQAMRDASKTGGALGNVSNFELQSVQNALASLDKAQSPQAMRESLQQIIDYVAGAKERLHSAYARQYGERKTTEPARYQPGGQTATQVSPPGGGSIPPAAIAHLKQHPELQTDFDAYYGTGLAASVLTP